MIVDPHKQDGITSRLSSESPPSYEAVASCSDTMGANGHEQQLPVDSKPAVSSQEPAQPYTFVGPIVHQPGYLPPPTIHHYVNPTTGQRIASLLPPDHPEMICLQTGMHETQTKFGLLGVLAAIFWFPLGVGLCMLDRQVRCQRCGLILNEGLCN